MKMEDEDGLRHVITARRVHVSVVDCDEPCNSILGLRVRAVVRRVKVQSRIGTCRSTYGKIQALLFGKRRRPLR